MPNIQKYTTKLTHIHGSNHVRNSSSLALSQLLLPSLYYNNFYLIISLNFNNYSVKKHCHITNRIKSNLPAITDLIL